MADNTYDAMSFGFGSKVHPVFGPGHELVELKMSLSPEVRAVIVWRRRGNGPWTSLTAKINNRAYPGMVVQDRVPPGRYEYAVLFRRNDVVEQQSIIPVTTAVD